MPTDAGIRPSLWPGLISASAGMTNDSTSFRCHPRACPEDPSRRILDGMERGLNRSYWVYILASRPQGTLYVGVTNDILGRVENHRLGRGSIFTAKYRVATLVFFEEFGDIELAIQREKTLKAYNRAWKINLIERENPRWIDLYPELKKKFG
jgi:putative endonuclease